MPGNLGEGTITTDGTEQTVVSSTDNRVIVFAINTKNMAPGDKVEMRVKTKISNVVPEDSLDLAFFAVYAHAQSQPKKYSTPIPSDIQLDVTIKRVAGTDRAYRWKLYGI